MASKPDARLVEVADELYGLAPGEFTSARTARSKSLRADDRALAAAVGKLPKATAPAWVVNQLVRHEGARIAEVLELGASLRSAQQQLDAAQLRLLATQRRQLTTSLTTEARALGERLGERVSEQVADQVHQTLTAAMVDGAAAEAVRTGFLLRAISANGVDPVDAAGLVAVPDAVGHVAPENEPVRPQLHVVPDPADSGQEAAAATRRLEDAQRTVSVRQRALTAASSEVETLALRAGSVRDEIERLQARIAEATADLGRLETRMESAEESLAQDEAELHKAELVAHRAAAEVEALGGPVPTPERDPAPEGSDA